MMRDASGPLIGWPSNERKPADGKSRPATNRNNVDLLQQHGPKIPTNSPGLIVTLTRYNTGSGCPSSSKQWLTSRIERAAPRTDGTSARTAVSDTDVWATTALALSAKPRVDHAAGTAG